MLKKGPVRTLVIEDNLTNLELMTYVLSAFGHVTTSATDGEEGIQAALDSTPSVIICDIQLPKLNGYEVARKLKAHPELRHIPLIAVTALAMVGDRERILAEGFDGYIAKPISPDVFAHQVESYLPLGERLGYQWTGPAETLNEDGEAAIAGRGVVLLINHSSSNIELARNLLEPSGFTVLVEADPVNAVSMASLSRPDVVLYDVHSQQDRGVWLVRNLNANLTSRPVPIILLSSSAWSDSDHEEIDRYASVLFLVRPLDPPMLLAQINTCLAQTV